MTSTKIKSAIFLVLLAVTAFFGAKWYLKTDKESEDRIKAIESEYKELQAKKDSSDAKIAVWHTKFDSIRGEDIALKNQVEHLSKQTAAAERAATKSKLELDAAKAHTETLRANIAKLESNPPNRTGDDLLQSLKNKMK